MADIPDEEELLKQTNDALKNLCKTHSLAQTGKKADLVARLVEFKASSSSAPKAEEESLPVPMTTVPSAPAPAPAPASTDSTAAADAKAAQAAKREADLAKKQADIAKRQAENAAKAAAKAEADRKPVEPADVTSVPDVEIPAEEDNSSKGVVRLSPLSSTLNFVSTSGGLQGSSFQHTGGFSSLWAGARANFGVSTGKFMFQVTIKSFEDVNAELKEEEPSARNQVRVGWSCGAATSSNLYGLGDLPNSFAYASNAQKITDDVYGAYGEKLAVGDVIGVFIAIEEAETTVSFSRNRTFLGTAFSIPAKEGAERPVYFPHVLLKNATIVLNFGPEATTIPAAPVPEPAAGGKEDADAPAAKEEPAVTPIPTDYHMMQAKGSKTAAGLIPGPSFVGPREAIFMVGLPGSGKTHWANDLIAKHPEKSYYLLGPSSLFVAMKVGGFKKRDRGSGRRLNILAKRATDLFEVLLKVAPTRQRNYIIDHSNVFKTARERRARLFVDAGFACRATVILLSEDAARARVSDRNNSVVEDKEAAKAGFSLPEAGDLFGSVEMAGDITEPATAAGRATAIVLAGKQAQAAAHAPRMPLMGPFGMAMVPAFQQGGPLLKRARGPGFPGGPVPPMLMMRGAPPGMAGPRPGPGVPVRMPLGGRGGPSPLLAPPGARRLVPVAPSHPPPSAAPSIAQMRAQQMLQAQQQAAAQQAQASLRAQQEAATRQQQMQQAAVRAQQEAAARAQQEAAIRAQQVQQREMMLQQQAQQAAAQQAQIAQRLQQQQQAQQQQALALQQQQAQIQAQAQQLQMQQQQAQIQMQQQMQQQQAQHAAALAAAQAAAQAAQAASAQAQKAAHQTSAYGYQTQQPAQADSYSQWGASSYGTPSSYVQGSSYGAQSQQAAPPPPAPASSHGANRSSANTWTPQPPATPMSTNNWNTGSSTSSQPQAWQQQQQPPAPQWGARR